MPNVRPQLEVADLVRSYADQLCQRQYLSPAQLKVMRHIANCRTAILGGHVDRCDSCGLKRISYNSCRDRHCPKCQGKQRQQWLQQRLQRLLPTTYFHVVFTIPKELGPIICRNKRTGYKILFDAAAKTLQQITADPKRLAAQIAVTCVLHTWAQNLLFHPHLHCVVSGGGLSLDGTRWIAGNERFFLPVRVLARMFRGKFLAAINDAVNGGTVKLDDTASGSWANLRDQLYNTDWIVYAKAPFAGPEHLFAYLGSYTHRVAISNRRLVRLVDDRVTFKVRDRGHPDRQKDLTLDAVEFLRRLMLHVLPYRFVRIRHYGLVAGRNVDTKLAIARQLIQANGSSCQRTKLQPPAGTENVLETPRWMICPDCGGTFIRCSEKLPDTPTSCLAYRTRASPLDQVA